MAPSRIVPLAVTCGLIACGSGKAKPDETTGRAGAGAEAAAAPIETCSLAGGAVRVGVRRPPGHAFARSAESCMLAEEPGTEAANEIPLFVTISTIEAGATEQALDSTEAVVRWIEATGLLGSNVGRLGTEETALAGHQVRVHRLVGEPEGLGTRREVAVAALHQASRYVVVMGVYPPGDDAARNRVHEIMRALTLP